MNFGKNKGFTLVEFIVAIVISATLGIAIYTVFSQGVRLWNRSLKDKFVLKSGVEVENLAGYVRNIFIDDRWRFRGSGQELFFASLDTIKRKPVYSRLFFLPDEKSIHISQYALEDILRKDFDLSKQKPAKELLWRNISKMKLEYDTYDEKKMIKWTSSWNKDCLPQSIKITMEYDFAKTKEWSRRMPLMIEKECRE